MPSTVNLATGSGKGRGAAMNDKIINASGTHTWLKAKRAKDPLYWWFRMAHGKAAAEEYARAGERKGLI